MNKYRECVRPCRERAKTCLYRLEGVCEASKIRSLKPVRLQMPTVQKLREIFPHLKIIHNVRDPRAVVMSRKSTSRAFQSNFATQGGRFDVVKEATLFCRNLNRDKLMFNSIIEQFPNSSLQVIYEEFATNPIYTAKSVYEFLGTNVPDEVVTWLQENTNNAHSKA